MTNGNDDDANGAPRTNPQPDRLGRRLLVLNLSVVTILPGISLSLSAEPMPNAPVIPVVTDSDPSDQAGRGRSRPRSSGLTDSDPGDSQGNGRGRPKRAGVTDADPGDGPPYTGSMQRNRTRLTDADPGDILGNGRGTGRTDADPGDAAGNGRGARSKQ